MSPTFSRCRQVAALLLLALLIRAGWALTQGRRVDAGLPDQQEYLQLSANLLDGRGLVLHDDRFDQDVYAYRTPGYPLFLAALAANPVVVRLAQALLDTSTVLAIYLLARRWLDHRPSFLAAAMVAVNPFLIYFSGLLLSETLFTAMLAWSMFLLTGRRAFLFGALLLAMAVLVRPSVLLLPILLAAPAALLTGRSSWRSLLIMSLLLLAVLFPWALRNRQVLGQWVWLTSNGGITRYDGFHPRADGGSDQSFLTDPALPSVKKMTELQRDKFFTELADSYIRQTWHQQPSHLVYLTVSKIARTWSPIPLSSQFGGRRAYVVVALLYTIPLDLLIVSGIWVAGGLGWRAKVFLALPAVYFTLIHALSVGSLRYRLPAEPPLTILAAMGLMSLLGYLRCPHPMTAVQSPPSPPLTPRRPLRPVFMLLLLLFLIGIIWGYWMLTDSDRVRVMAQTYLSQIIGGHVEVERANLSIFEGLRLEGVSLYVDESSSPDSRLFSAHSVLVKANLRLLLRGRLEATEIEAVEPQVHLCENLDSGLWNYQRLIKTTRPPQATPVPDDHPMVLPQIRLRAGLVEYSRLSAGRYDVVGSMAIDGHLTPAGSRSRYSFDLDGRALGQPTGPRLQGTVDTNIMSVDASLDNFEFDRTIRLMLPSEVQEWWEAHQLAGHIRIPRLLYRPAVASQPPVFRVEVELEDVRLAVLPAELMGHREYERQKMLRPGFNIATYDDFQYVGRTQAVEQVLQPQPIGLRNVSGRFIFTRDQIILSSVSGKVANNRVTIDGRVGGYSERAPVNLRVLANNILIPRLPRFIYSLPADARREYEKFRPVGRANLAVELRRQRADGPVDLRAQLSILDGGFCFEEFAYPLRNVRGTLAYGRDPISGNDWVSLRNLTGYGPENSLNHDKLVTVNGWVAPLVRGSGVDVRIVGRDIWLDPLLWDALPDEAMDVVRKFDRRNYANKSARPLPAIYPTVPCDVHAAFTAHLRRVHGLRPRLDVDVDLDIFHAVGAYSEFPYPLRDVTGRVLVRPNHVALENFRTKDGNSWIKVDGKVTFGKNQPVEPKLTITAANIPVDADLRWALPTKQRQWFEKLDLGGKLDVAGRLFLAKSTPATQLAVAAGPSTNPKKEDFDVDFDLGLKLTGGHVWPVEKVHAVADLTADLHLSSTQLLIKSATGKRGDASVTGHGKIAWPKNQNEFALVVHATNVVVDKVMYQLVPDGAQSWWDQIRPVGKADLDVMYRDSDMPGDTSTFSVLIRPRGAAITPVHFPWVMNNITGDLLVTPQGVTLTDIVLRHGPATVRLAGTGKLSSAAPSTQPAVATTQPAADSEGPNTWVLKVSGQDLVVDNELVAAIPPTMSAVSTLLKSAKLQGKLSIDQTELTYITAESAHRAAAAAAGPPPQIRFQSRITLDDASLEVAVPFSAVNGTLDLDATIRNGQLDTFSGAINASSLLVDGRAVRNFRADVKKLVHPNMPAGESIYFFNPIRAKLAGGNLDAKLTLRFPRYGAAQYGVVAVVKDMDLRTLLGEARKDWGGQLTGRLDLNGNWDDPASRFGTGNVKVEGKGLMEIPVVFGFVQMANLAMPVKNPFNDASIDYSIKGQSLNLTDIRLGSDNMVMKGNGKIDFDSRKVAMDFTTYNPNLPNIPFFGSELFKIQVTGTVQSQKVRTRSFSTFVTTIDQVLTGPPRGGNPSQEKKK